MFTAAYLANQTPSNAHITNTATAKDYLLQGVRTHRNAPQEAGRQTLSGKALGYNQGTKAHGIYKTTTHIR